MDLTPASLQKFLFKKMDLWIQTLEWLKFTFNKKWKAIMFFFFFLDWVLDDEEPLAKYLVA